MLNIFVSHTGFKNETLFSVIFILPLYNAIGFIHVRQYDLLTYNER